MSRITIELAENIAKQLTAKKQQKLNDLNVKISKHVRDEVLKSIPEHVKMYFAEFPQYCYTHTQVTLVGNGCNHERVNVDEFPRERASNSYYTPSPFFGKEFPILINNKDALKEEIYKLKRDIENALKQMRTFKAVREQFPEAAAFLPANNKVYLPSLDLSQIRESLKD
jgi:hypothetical protein